MIAESTTLRRVFIPSDRSAGIALLFALLGYGYIAAVLALALAFVAGYIGAVYALARAGVSELVIFVLWPMGSLGVIVAIGLVEILVMRVPAPHGIALERPAAPALFALLDQLSRVARVPRLHRVLVTEDIDTMLTQRPRLGMLWTENTLSFGLPLAEGLSLAEFRAVLAHELGHLSTQAGWLSAWLHRLEEGWRQIGAAGFEQDLLLGAFLFRPFLRWYLPRFNAHAESFRADQEWVADEVAQRLCGAQACADALSRTQILEGFCRDRFWPALWRQADDESEPADAYRRLGKMARGAVSDSEARRWLGEALGMPPSAVVGHLPPAERLAALGVPPRLPPAFERSAADELLASLLGSLEAELSRRWAASAAQGWAERHSEMQGARQQLAAVEAKGSPLDPAEAFERAVLVERVRGANAALPLYEQSAGADLENAGAAFAVGRILLERNNAAGVAAIERAMSVDPRFGPEGCRLIAEFLASEKSPLAALPYRQRAERYGSA